MSRLNQAFIKAYRKKANPASSQANHMDSFVAGENPSVDHQYAAGVLYRVDTPADASQSGSAESAPSVPAPYLTYPRLRSPLQQTPVSQPTLDQAAFDQAPLDSSVTESGQVANTETPLPTRAHLTAEMRWKANQNVSQQVAITSPEPSVTPPAPVAKESVSHTAPTASAPLSVASSVSSLEEQAARQITAIQRAAELQALQTSNESALGPILLVRSKEEGERLLALKDTISDLPVHEPARPSSSLETSTENLPVAVEHVQPAIEEPSASSSLVVESEAENVECEIKQKTVRIDAGEQQPAAPHFTIIAGEDSDLGEEEAITSPAKTPHPNDNAIDALSTSFVETSLFDASALESGEIEAFTTTIETFDIPEVMAIETVAETDEQAVEAPATQEELPEPEPIGTEDKADSCGCEFPAPSETEASKQLEVEPEAESEPELEVEADSKVEPVTEAPMEPVVESDAKPTLEPFNAAWEVDRFQWPSICQQLLEAEREYFELAGKNLCSATQDGLNVLAITGLHRGDGKSTLSLCLAKAAAAAGVRVALFDADLEHPSLSSLLGLDAPFSWPQSSIEQAPLTEMAISSLEDGVTFFPLNNRETSSMDGHSGSAGSSLADALPSEEEAAIEKSCDLISQAAAHFDLVILDMGCDGESHRPHFLETSKTEVDAAIVVRDLRNSNEEQMRTTIAKLHRYGVESVGIAENFVRQS